MKEKEIIIIGIIATLLVLATLFGILYLVYQNEEKNNTNSQENTNLSKEEITNEDNIDNKNEENIESTIKEENINVDNENNDIKNTVTLYLFRGNGCHFCENAIQFLETLPSEYSYLNIEIYEVWNNEENANLMNEVARKLDLEVSSSVPFIVIGNTYARRGFAEGMISGIKKEIEESYHSNTYEDIVKEIIKEKDIQVKKD